VICVSEVESRINPGFTWNIQKIFR
jgi:hypothetical protein